MDKINILDKDIREPLFEFLEEMYGKIRILEEKTMGQSRADVVMITENSLYGIEIKSDADSYARLARQVKDYDKYFDYNYAVVGSSHAMHIREHLPEYWGVITVEEVDGILDFYILSKARENPKMQWKRKLEILWRTELVALQDAYSMPKYKEKSKAFVVGKILAWVEKGKIPQDHLRKMISHLLFERDYTTIANQISEYRRGEIAKQLDRETDIEARVEMLSRQSHTRQIFRKRTRRRKIK